MLAACLLAGACASTPQQEPVTTAPVVAAERAFAASAAEIGWVQAFRRYVAPDGTLLRPEPVNAPEVLAAEEDRVQRDLAWWPAYAGIARSGDFGFTTGPFALGDRPVGGHYFTVWRKQPDGSWKWIFDGGPMVTDTSPIARDGEPGALPVATRGVGSADAAVAAVRAIETASAEDAAILAYMAEDVRVNRMRLPPSVGRAAAAAAYARPAGSVRYELVRADGSAAGDLVFTLADVRWAGAEGERGGHVGRIWQLRPEGWRIVYDQITPRPPPRPPTAP